METKERVEIINGKEIKVTTLPTQGSKKPELKKQKTKSKRRRNPSSTKSEEFYNWNDTALYC